MIFRRIRLRVVVLLFLLVGFSSGMGFFGGLVLSSVIAKKKEDPAFWKEAALKHLEKLNPDDEQRKAFAARTDTAVRELSNIRTAAITDVWDVINRAAADIEKVLTPDQREVFEKIRPREKPLAEK